MNFVAQTVGDIQRNFCRQNEEKKENGPIQFRFRAPFRLTLVGRLRCVLRHLLAAVSLRLCP